MWSNFKNSKDGSIKKQEEWREATLAKYFQDTKRARRFNFFFLNIYINFKNQPVKRAPEQASD